MKSERARAAARLRTAFALHEAGKALQKEKFRREDPTADEAALRQRVAEWLAWRDPEQDYGRPIRWPRE